MIHSMIFVVALVISCKNIYYEAPSTVSQEGYDVHYEG